jgi:hypothetical protein
VIGAEVTIDSPDFGHLGPMVAATEHELREAGVSEAPEVVVADAGYWHQAQMEDIVTRGIQVLGPPDASKRKGARPGWDGGFYALHAPRVGDRSRCRALWQTVMIEPVFGDVKFNRRIDRFQRRGRSACRSEWRLIAATHNLLKLHAHQMAATAA